MHIGMVRKDGEKMSKSLGNLVFVDRLREDWDPRAIRLAIVEHHYRDSWEWDEEMMPRADTRLTAWRKAALREGPPDSVLDEVRAALDNDLNAPGALVSIDAAAGRGEDVREAAALLGVDLY
jgi:L-cysteine:1D-myo-inositol 2-amino-2-deoxy-alpha-D-glucopyranoside ligase